MGKEISDKQEKIIKKEISIENLRAWLIKTNSIQKKEKKHFLINWEDLSSMEIDSLKDDYFKERYGDKEDNTWFKKILENFYLALHSVFYKNQFIRTLVIIFIFIWSYSIYSTPYWININAFPISIWKIRWYLNILENKFPDIHKMVIENIDEVNVDYLERPSNKWWHALDNDWKIKVRIFKIWETDYEYYISLLAHEACHWVQFKDWRIYTEPRQKIENECTYLWLYTLEKLNAPSNLIIHVKEAAEDPSWQWWNWWKNSWTSWDTTNWLMDLIPKEKQKDYKVFWYNYNYE